MSIEHRKRLSDIIVTGDVPDKVLSNILVFICGYAYDESPETEWFWKILGQEFARLNEKSVTVGHTTE